MFTSLTVIGVFLLLGWMQHAFLQRMIITDIEELKEESGM
jgi:hypothetical protein